MERVIVDPHPGGNCRDFIHRWTELNGDKRATLDVASNGVSICSGNDFRIVPEPRIPHCQSTPLNARQGRRGGLLNRTGVPPIRRRARDRRAGRASRLEWFPSWCRTPAAGLHHRALDIVMRVAVRLRDDDLRYAGEARHQVDQLGPGFNNHTRTGFRGESRVPAKLNFVAETLFSVHKDRFTGDIGSAQPKWFVVFPRRRSDQPTARNHRHPSANAIHKDENASGRRPRSVSKNALPSTMAFCVVGVQCQRAVEFAGMLRRILTAPLQRQRMLLRRHRIVGQQAQHILISGACFFPPAEARERGRDFQITIRVIGGEDSTKSRRNEARAFALSPSRAIARPWLNQICACVRSIRNEF